MRHNDDIGFWVEGMIVDEHDEANSRCVPMSEAMSIAEPRRSVPEDATNVIGNSVRPERSRKIEMRFSTESPGRRYAHSRKCHSAKVGMNSWRSARSSICTVGSKSGTGKFPVPHYDTYRWRRFDEETV